MVVYRALYYGEIGFVILGVLAGLFALVVLGDLAWSARRDRGGSHQEPLDARDHHLAAH
jgi:hypothetical protein